MSPPIAIGVGCRRGSSANAIEALVRQALDLRAWGEMSEPLPTMHQRRNVMVGAGRPSTTYSARSTQKFVDGRPAPTMTAGGDVPGFAVFIAPHALTPQAERLGLFTIRDKTGETGLIEAACRLGLDLIFLTRDTLREQAPYVQTRSTRSQIRFGVPSVAESAALAGAGPNSVLIIPRIASQGVTCAIAEAWDQS